MFFGNLDKFLYLTVEDLDYKPSTVEQARFDIPHSINFLIEGWKNKTKRRTFEKTKIYWRLKRRAAKNNWEQNQHKIYIDSFDKNLTLEAIALIKEIKIIGDSFDYSKLSFTGDNKIVLGFKNFKTLENLIKYLFNKNMTTDEAEIKQRNFSKSLINWEFIQQGGLNILSQKNKFLKMQKTFMTDWKKYLWI